MKHCISFDRVPKMFALAGLMVITSGWFTSAHASPLTDDTWHVESEDLAVLRAMDEAIQDEYRAYETYKNIVTQFGEVLPFARIVQAESRHIAALERLYGFRGLTAPASEWSELNVPTYASVSDACAASVDGELENIAMYDRLLRMNLPSDVRFVFENVRSASLERHLPAFRRCGGAA